jgi:hypothetical protein
MFSVSWETVSVWQGSKDAMTRSWPQGCSGTINIPDIDFQGREVLGEGSTDLVLTLDIDFSKNTWKIGFASTLPLRVPARAWGCYSNRAQGVSWLW